MTDFESLLQDLRSQPFYRGQISRVRYLPGKPAENRTLVDMLDRIPAVKNGVLEQLLPLLGIDDPYANMVAGLEHAFPSDLKDGSDALLVAPKSKPREDFWQLVCFAEALDKGRLCLVLCRDAAHLDGVMLRLKSTVVKADIAYALSIVSVSESDDFSKFLHDVPMIVVLTPETLRDLLQSVAVGIADARNVILSALGRVSLPDLEEWSPAAATNTAFLFRQLHLECAKRGVFPALTGSVTPRTSVDEFISELWGKPINSKAFIVEDSVEASPICMVNYGGTMIQEEPGGDLWTRESVDSVAHDLLGWLVGKNQGVSQFGGAEVHYVLDVSGSMEFTLEGVGDALVNDLQMRLDDGTLQPGDKVKLFVFNTDTKQVFPESPVDTIPDDTKAFVEAFKKTVHMQKAEGGTDLPLGLLKSIEAAMTGQSKKIDIILFSDGGSCILPSYRTKLLRMTRQAHQEGRPIGLLYVVLDMIPPVNIENLIREMGGAIVEKSQQDLKQKEIFATKSFGRETVLFLAGEKALPASILQQHFSGIRRLVYTRDGSELVDKSKMELIDPRSVVAVVVSGRYGRLRQILDQVLHLGWHPLPVFILSDAEAWAQVLCEDYAEIEEIGTAALIWPQNPFARGVRLREMIGHGEIDAELFAYLAEGKQRYLSMLSRLGVDVHASRVPTQSEQLETAKVIDGWVREERSDACFVKQSAGRSSVEDHLPLDTFSAETIKLEGDGVKCFVDKANSALIFHPGAIVDSQTTSSEVGVFGFDRIELVARSLNRSLPLISDIRLTVKEEERWKKKRLIIDRLGTVSSGFLSFSGKVDGTRKLVKSNLDDNVSDERWDESLSFAFETFALKWEPCGLSPTEGRQELVTSLANILRLTSVSALHHAEQTLFIYPDGAGVVWLVDLAVGGNGASEFLYRHIDIFTNMLKAGGRILLDCPCEGGFATASKVKPAKAGDSGCPRCVRVSGAQLSQAGQDLSKAVSKFGVLNWLLANQYLPVSGLKHIQDKYDGIDDRTRFVAPGHGSRRGIIPLIRRILRDRLGIEIPEEALAVFAWLENNKTCLGLYESAPNRLSVVKGLPEWADYDVCAHELFHNYQCKVKDLFNDNTLGEQATKHIGWDGKLFIEGSAMWCASQIIDALAIRTCLTAASLRSGDEYGAGFKIFKYIEQGAYRHKDDDKAPAGIDAVLKFLATGDISTATGGLIRDLDDLLNQAEVERK